MTELTMNPRGPGLNWLPCFVCGHLGDKAQPDLASFVADEQTGIEIVMLFHRAGLAAVLDMRRAREGRFQVKVGACHVHEPNLVLLNEVASSRYDYHGNRYQPEITEKLLAMIKPGETP